MAPLSIAYFICGIIKFVLGNWFFTASSKVWRSFLLALTPPAKMIVFGLYWAAAFKVFDTKTSTIACSKLAQKSLVVILSSSLLSRSQYNAEVFNPAKLNK